MLKTFFTSSIQYINFKRRSRALALLIFNLRNSVLEPVSIKFFVSFARFFSKFLTDFFLISLSTNGSNITSLSLVHWYCINRDWLMAKVFILLAKCLIKLLSLSLSSLLSSFSSSSVSESS